MKEGISERTTMPRYAQRGMCQLCSEVICGDQVNELSFKPKNITLDPLIHSEMFHRDQLVKSILCLNWIKNVLTKVYDAGTQSWTKSSLEFRVASKRLPLGTVLIERKLSVAHITRCSTSSMKRHHGARMANLKTLPSILHSYLQLQTAFDNSPSYVAILLWVLSQRQWKQGAKLGFKNANLWKRQSSHHL
jgi:hypothetical protein